MYYDSNRSIENTKKIFEARLRADLDICIIGKKIDS